MSYSKATLFVLFVALIVASASAAGENGAGTIPRSGGSTSMDNWYTFYWTGGEPTSASPSFPYDSEVGTRIIVTDAYNPGDQFRVYDSQVVLGITSTPVDPVNLPPYWTNDPDTAFATSEFSKGCFDVGPGTHEISVEVIKNPWEYGNAFLRIEEGSCPETPVPEFPSLLLPLTFIVGVLGTVLMIRRTRNS